MRKLLVVFIVGSFAFFACQHEPILVHGIIHIDTTGNGGCGIAVGLYASSITSTSVMLNWSAVNGATSYVVQYRVVGSGTWTPSTVSTNSQPLSGLIANTSYEFQVQTICPSGSSAFSGSATFTTATSGGDTLGIHGAIQSGGIYGNGYLFSYDISTGNFVELFDFDSTNGSVPNGLMQSSNGLLYGLTAFGGTYSQGVLYSLDPLTNQQTVYFNFHGKKGSIPRGNLIEASDGFFYGTTSGGGDSLRGTIFKFDPVSGAIKTEFSFHDVYGESPEGDLLEVDPTTSAFELEKNAAFAIQPVPNNGRFTVSIKNSNYKSIFISDAFGRRVYSRYFPEGNTNNTFSADLVDYPNGIYWLQFISADGCTNKKIIIQR